MNSANYLASSLALSLLAFSAFSPWATAESEVFSTSGVHRKIETFLDSTHRFSAQGSDPSKELARAHKTVDVLKAKGGLPYAKAATELGCLLMDKERYDEAKPLLKEALELKKSALADTDPNLAAAMHNVGALYELRKKGGDATDYYFSAMKVVTEGKPTEFRAYEEQNLGEYMYEKNDLQTAESFFRRSLKDRDELSSKPSRETSELLDSLSRCLEEEGHGEEAKPSIARLNAMPLQLPKMKVPKGWG